MASETTFCPNCGAQIKSGLFSSNNPITGSKVEAINSIFNLNHTQYCEKCIKPLIEEARRMKSTYEDYIATHIGKVPIITNPMPMHWDYQSVSIVTGQSVIGTGVISEFKSSFTDLFGLHSGSFTAKIAQCESDCFLQIRSKALKLGCNAIIATDIDYGELGSIKGMIMVCCAGTAVKLHNPSIIGEDESVLSNMILYSSNLKLIHKLALQME